MVFPLIFLNPVWWFEQRVFEKLKMFFDEYGKKYPSLEIYMYI